MVTTADVPFWLRLGPLTRAVQAYGRAQRKRPWATQVCTSLAIYICADLSAQHISGKEYDAERTCRSIIIGGTASIPNFEWYVHYGDERNHTQMVCPVVVVLLLT